MKYKVGDRVKIQSLERYNKYKNRYGDINYGCETKILFTSEMSSFCGQVVTITRVRYIGCVRFYHLAEDKGDHLWVDGMFEGLVGEEVDLIPKFGEYSDREPLDVPTMTTDFVKEHGLPCPNGYIFKDENGNIINATKIVLEKKKKEYPKTFEECCKILGLLNVDLCFNADYRSFDASKEQWKRLGLMNQFYQLLICRDAYWKIAGEEMGLGKPWKPDWKNDEQFKYIIICRRGCIIKDTYTAKDIILSFPTAEMRDAFYDNFKELIENCKELL